MKVLIVEKDKKAMKKERRVESNKSFRMVGKGVFH
jgi:hypothetical protein